MPALNTGTNDQPSDQVAQYDATGRYGARVGTRNWWTTIQERFTGKSLEARVGDVPMLHQAPTPVFLDRFGRSYADFSTAGNRPNDFLQAEIPKFSETFTIVNTLFMTVNSSHPLSIWFGRAAELTSATPAMYIRPRQQGTDKQVRFVRDGGTVFLTTSGQVPVNAASLIFTVVDPVAWTVKQAIGTGAFTETLTAENFHSFAAPDIWTLRIGAYSGGSGFGGAVPDTMLLAGDIASKGTLQADLSAFFSSINV